MQSGAYVYVCVSCLEDVNENDKWTSKLERVTNISVCILSEIKINAYMPTSK